MSDYCHLYRECGWPDCKLAFSKHWSECPIYMQKTGYIKLGASKTGQLKTGINTPEEES